MLEMKCNDWKKIEIGKTYHVWLRGEGERNRVDVKEGRCSMGERKKKERNRSREKREWEK